MAYSEGVSQFSTSAQRRHCQTGALKQKFPFWSRSRENYAIAITFGNCCNIYLMSLQSWNFKIDIVEPSREEALYDCPKNEWFFDTKVKIHPDPINLSSWELQLIQNTPFLTYSRYFCIDSTALLSLCIRSCPRCGTHSLCRDCLVYTVYHG